MSDDTNAPESESESQPGPDEMFCMDCGSVIKKRAEICPECGVRQDEEESTTPQQTGESQISNDLTDRRQYELENMASKDTTTIILVGILISPVAYWMVGKKGLAIINFFTLNFFFLGPIIVPIHCYKMIENAEEELRRAGVRGY